MSACSKAIAGPCSALIADGTTRPTGYLCRVVTQQSGSDGFFLRCILLVMWVSRTGLSSGSSPELREAAQRLAVTTAQRLDVTTTQRLTVNNRPGFAAINRQDRRLEKQGLAEELRHEHDDPRSRSSSPSSP